MSDIACLIHIEGGPGARSEAVDAKKN
eukprot:COSAG02_NODE_52266_length_309_cov_0.395238_1_plen_26_part_10